MTENGGFALPLDMLCDAKSLYDVVTLPREPTPTDSSALLWLCWLREQLASGVVRQWGWCSTEDMIADGLTKRMSQDAIFQAMKGSFKSKYAILLGGKLIDSWKGAPPPKNQKKECSMMFVKHLHDLFVGMRKQPDAHTFFSSLCL